MRVVLMALSLSLSRFKSSLSSDEETDSMETPSTEPEREELLPEHSGSLEVEESFLWHIPTSCHHEVILMYILSRFEIAYISSKQMLMNASEWYARLPRVLLKDRLWRLRLEPFLFFLLYFY